MPSSAAAVLVVRIWIRSLNTKALFDYDASDTQKVLARYTGFGDGAAKNGREMMGGYRVFERYNSRLRRMR